MEGRALFFSAFISVEYTLSSFYYTLEDLKRLFLQNKNNIVKSNNLYYSRCTRLTGEDSKIM